MMMDDASSLDSQSLYTTPGTIRGDASTISAIEEGRLHPYGTRYAYAREEESAPSKEVASEIVIDNEAPPPKNNRRRTCALAFLVFIVVVGILVGVLVSQLPKTRDDEASQLVSEPPVNTGDGLDGGDTPTVAPTTSAPDTDTATTPVPETPATTSEPTNAPTNSPTDAPTNEPTKAPTEPPTTAPTDPPTNPPTDPPTPAPTTPAPARKCNGLESNCDKRVNEIMYATVHNAMSSEEDDFAAANNLKSLEDALEAGYRGLMLDSCKCGGEVKFCHSICWAGTRNVTVVMENIVSFLEENENEVLIIELQVDDDSLQDFWDVASLVGGFQELIYAHDGPGTPWPTLNELIDLKQRLLIFQHRGPNCDEGACPAGVHNTFTYMNGTPWDLNGSSELLDPNLSCVISDGDAEADFLVMNHFAAGLLGLPSRDIAEHVNAEAQLTARLEACKGVMSKSPNLLVVDFWSIGDVVAVVNAHNAAL